MDEDLEFLKGLMMVQPIIAEPIEFRIHYDSNENITMLSMQQHPTDTQYLVVSKEEYENYYDYKIVNGKLKKIDNRIGFSVRLKKSDSGYCVVKNHAGIILEEEYNNVEYYDTIN